MRRTIAIFGLIAALLLPAVPRAAVAQSQRALTPPDSTEAEPPPNQPPRRRNRPPAPPPAPDAQQPAPGPEVKDEHQGDKKKEKPDRYFAVTGAIVHTVSGPTLDRATILCKNGRIVAIGPRVAIPEGAEVLDTAAVGGGPYHVYPGLIAVRSIALVGGEPPDDTTDVFAVQMSVALAGGITTAVTGNTAAKLTLGTLEDMVVKRNLFESIRYRSSDPGAKRRLRQSLDKVRQYLRDKEAYDQNKDRDPDARAPDDKWLKAGDAAMHLRLLRGESIGAADAETADEILQVCDLAREYGIKVVVRGAREGWTVARQMSEAGLGVILTARTRVDPDPRMVRPNGATIENAAILHEHGVLVAIVPGQAGISFVGLGGRDLLQLNLEAAFAVRGGLPDEAAVRAITLDAARVLGIDRRVGSIEVGKDADFMIADGDLLHYMTQSRWTVVNGRIAYDKMKDTLLNHIRPNGETNPPPPPDIWPRRLGQDQ